MASARKTAGATKTQERPPGASRNAPAVPADASIPSPPRNFLRPCLLLLLREQPTHGDEMFERLQAFGFDRSDPGGVYRSLRQLENAGFVSSGEPSGSVPDRRIYELTRAGIEELHATAIDLAAIFDILTVFLSRYAEFVTVRGRPVKPDERR